jgi:iron-sulfur cluster repair protein YtfE (RIC family)
VGRSTISGYLERDHARLDALLAQCLATVRSDLEVATEYFRLFKEGLQRHMIWEEEILFPLYERKMGEAARRGPMHVVLMEHRMIEASLEQINDQIKLGDPRAGDAARKLADALAAHSDREERMLYPAFDTALEADELLHVIRSMEHLPEERYRGRSGGEMRK